MPLMSEEFQQSGLGKAILFTLVVMFQAVFWWLVLVTFPKKRKRR